MKALFAYIAGAIFGVGLLLSGMTQPAKVIGFLDITRHWDPTLAFVMGGAVAVYAVAMRLILRRPTPLLDTEFHMPTRADIDLPLLAGAAIFGIGWGLAGFCPGPGIVAAASGAQTALVFVGTMAIGMLIERFALRE